MSESDRDNVVNGTLSMRPECLVLQRRYLHAVEVMYIYLEKHACVLGS